MIRRSPRLILLAAICGAWAFGSRPADVRAETLSMTVAVGGKGILAYVPLTLADRLGYFRDEGLTVDIEDFQGGSKSLEALVGGSVDAVTGAYENTLFMAAKGIELTDVVLFQNRFGFVLGLSKELAARYHSPKDLKGLKFGVTAPGSATANALDIILAKDGLSTADVSVIAIGGGAGAVAIMETGQIDGVLHSDPTIMRLQLDGAIVPVIDSRKEAGQLYLYGGLAASSASYTTTAFAKSHPKHVQAYVNGIVRAIKWLQKATTDELVATVPASYYGRDKTAYEKSFEANRATFTKDGRITLALAEQTYKILVQSGRLKSAVRINVADTLDTTYAEVANRKY